LEALWDQFEFVADYTVLEQAHRGLHDQESGEPAWRVRDRLAPLLVVSVSNHEQNGSSFRLR